MNPSAVTLQILAAGPACPWTTTIQEQNENRRAQLMPADHITDHTNYKAGRTCQDVPTPAQTRGNPHSRVPSTDQEIKKLVSNLWRQDLGLLHPAPDHT